MKRALIVLAFLLWAHPAFAQVAFNGAVDGIDNGGSTSSLTFNSHSVSGSDRIGFVGCLGDNITGGADDLTGITWNSVAMTIVTKYTTPDISVNRFFYVYRLIAPATGATSIVVSASTNHYLLCSEVSYTGANQTGNPVEFNTNTATAGSTSLTTSLTTTVDNSWTILFAQGTSQGPAGAIGAGTGSTFRVEGAAFHNYAIFDSNAALTPTGSHSMQATYGGSGSFAGIIQIIVSIKPVAAASSSNVNRTGLLGVIKP